MVERGGLKVRVWESKGESERDGFEVEMWWVWQGGG